MFKVHLFEYPLNDRGSLSLGPVSVPVIPVVGDVICYVGNESYVVRQRMFTCYETLPNSTSVGLYVQPYSVYQEEIASMRASES